ncbi:MAG: hypothetical protein ACTTIV_00245 [Campylobacter sp.]
MALRSAHNTAKKRDNRLLRARKYTQKSSTKGREIWLCFSAASNVTSVKTDCKKLRDLGLKFGAKSHLTYLASSPTKHP